MNDILLEYKYIFLRKLLLIEDQELTNYMVGVNLIPALLADIKLTSSQKALKMMLISLNNLYIDDLYSDLILKEGLFPVLQNILKTELSEDCFKLCIFICRNIPEENDSYTTEFASSMVEDIIRVSKTYNSDDIGMEIGLLVVNTLFVLDKRMKLQLIEILKEDLIEAFIAVFSSDKTTITQLGKSIMEFQTIKELNHPIVDANLASVMGVIESNNLIDKIQTKLEGSIREQIITILENTMTD